MKVSCSRRPTHRSTHTSTNAGSNSTLFVQAIECLKHHEGTIFTSGRDGLLKRWRTTGGRLEVRPPSLLLAVPSARVHQHAARAAVVCSATTDRSGPMWQCVCGNECESWMLPSQTRHAKPTSTRNCHGSQHMSWPAVAADKCRGRAHRSGVVSCTQATLGAVHGAYQHFGY